MDVNFLLSHVDHTLLSPTATRAQIKQLCQEALKYQTASVCINPKYVSYALSILGDAIPVCTVIGFPLGATTTAVKVFEAAKAIEDGAREVDMVISVGDVKEGLFKEIQQEISAVKAAVGENILKVIVETCLLTHDEKVELCHVTEDGGADYIKTSTGFSTGGATFEDVTLFARETGGRIKIKAAGGIKSCGDMEKFLALGADRLGTSSGIKYAIQELNK